jgi:hypothetical protein
MLIDGLYARNEEGRDSRIPDSWFTRGVRPYFTSWVNGGQHTPIRWHWDRIAVNPHDSSGNFAAPSASPSFCLGQPDNTCPDPGTASNPSPTPTSPPAAATPTPRPSASPTPVPTTAAQQTITFDNLSNPNRPLSGQYPTNVIDWGTNNWYLSGPWRAFNTNSIGFNGTGRTSASFNFVSPRRLVQLYAYNGGSSASTVMLACAGQPTSTTTVQPGQLVTISTRWTGRCSRVDVSSSNGWDTNLDSLVID